MPTSVRRPFSDEFLLEYSREHLFYELDLFLDLADLIADGQKMPSSNGDVGRILNNVVLEASVIHLRVLLEFLYPAGPGPRPTDVTADDFMTAEWEGVRPEMPRSLQTALHRSHKEMAHLTSDRLPLNSGARRWNIPTLSRDIVPVFQSFVREAAESRLDSAIAQRIPVGL